jgi:hypothetical protein
MPGRGIVADFHFHIYWNARQFFEPEAFETRAQGVVRALDLSSPGELFNVKEFSARCPVCEPHKKTETSN